MENRYDCEDWKVRIDNVDHMYYIITRRDSPSNDMFLTCTEQELEYSDREYFIFDNTYLVDSKHTLSRQPISAAFAEEHGTVTTISLCPGCRNVLLLKELAE